MNALLSFLGLDSLAIQNILRHGGRDDGGDSDGHTLLNHLLLGVEVLVGVVMGLGVDASDGGRRQGEMDNSLHSGPFGTFLLCFPDSGVFGVLGVRRGVVG